MFLYPMHSCSFSKLVEADFEKWDSYLRPVSSLAPSCWASPPWLSLPFSLFSLHSRFLRPHPPPLQSHCLLHRCQSHLPHWHRGISGSPLFCLTEWQNQRSALEQKVDELTCWIVFGFGELVVRLLTATEIETRRSLEQQEWGEPRAFRKKPSDLVLSQQTRFCIISRKTWYKDLFYALWAHKININIWGNVCLSI